MKKNLMILTLAVCLAAMCNGCFLPLAWQAEIVANHDAVDAAVGIGKDAPK